MKRPPQNMQFIKNRIIAFPKIAWLATILIFLLSAHPAKADALLSYQVIRNRLKSYTGQEYKELVTIANAFLKEIDNALAIIAIEPEDAWSNIEILRDALSTVDFDAVKRKDKESLVSSIQKARTILKPIEKLSKSYTLYLIGYSHIDLAWLWPKAEAERVWNVTSQNALKLMTAYPDFIFSQSQAAAYEWMEKRHKETFKAIQERVRKGQWEILGGTWVEPDSNLPSGESFVRQCLYGKRYFREKFGVEVTIGWTPDSFGYNWNLPQIYKKCGMVGFLTQKISWNDTTKFPYNIFWWEAPDGSRLLTYFPPGTYNEKVEPDRMLDQLHTVYTRHREKKVAVIYGYGDHGGGPTDEMVARAHQLQKTQVYPSVAFSTATSFFDAMANIAKRKGAKIPIVRDELYLEYHRGTYTTQSKVKDNNRRGEVLLETLEKVSSLANAFRLPYPKKQLRHLWKVLLLNQFHDILPGSSIRKVYKDSGQEFEQLFKSGQAQLNRAFKHIAQHINTQGKGKPIVVFNSLSFPRSEVVETDITSNNASFVLTPEGKTLPMQRIVKNKKTLGLFLAKNVPPIGFKVFYLVAEGKEKNRLHRSNPVRVEKNSSSIQISNRYFTIKIDNKSGNIASIYDKQAKREIVANGKEANLLQFYEDYPREYEAWNIGMGRSLGNARFIRSEILEEGPLRAKVKIYQTYNKSKFTTAILLYRNLPVIDFEMDALWKEKQVIAKLSFPLRLQNCFATFEIPYAAIERSTVPRTLQEMAKWEQSAQKWLDYTEGTASFLNLRNQNCSKAKAVYGVSLLNRNKYGFDVKGNVMRITLLRGPIFPDIYADMGKHRIFYRLYPHQKSWREAKTVNLAYAYNYPLLVNEAQSHPGSLPSSYSFYRLSPDTAHISVIKKAEDEDSIILRIVETIGKKTKITLTLPRKAKTVEEADLLERAQKTIAKQKRKLTIQLQRFEIKTLKVKYD